ncbi:zinc finger protein 280C isoform X2 [Austrofundulus limnaeus]|uniref:Zinc finger protein 280C isoform X2 n=1 Tax=Austrofundulus limnaeus TaxID=52670 RepID=A0A2I4CSY6_AUSLI|nr:PREDICTED: zinc finger protein 280D isoform X2 [Austrofundulus limnaeus]
MSELFMECVEEDLEPWQKPAPQVHLIEDDDDEPIFVGVLSNNQKDDKTKPAPRRKDSVVTQKTKLAPPQSVDVPSPVVLPLSVPVPTAKPAPPTLTTMTPQPVIVNNQGFIVTSPQLTNSNDLIAALGAQYPPGTSFTIVPAPHSQIFQQASSPSVIPGGVHRPQVQQIKNNVVTLSNVQSPAMYSAKPGQQPQLKRPISQSVPGVSMSPAAPVKDNNIVNKNQITVKRALTSQEVDSVVKKTKLDFTPAKVTIRMENGIAKKNCPNCREEFLSEESLKFHIMCCRGIVASQPPSAPSTGPHKIIMLVSDFYYGRFEGDPIKMAAQKTNTTFKCQSCLKVLKNNIRFMNHMKHHLELEKQNSESWESHTTCHHCYRQYMTPFQLQCHIESAHSPIESPTNCKICELAFESEQLLLEHMKTTHKPGEMPYVCQVCNFRSSFFSEVETHFRRVHENTKDMLCPFCLKVVRSCHSYMQHYMKHQKKGIHRCGRCRLNFLTYKEKIDHRTHLHKTFRKPKALEGLPPGTKVTIRASFSGKGPSAMMSPDLSGITIRAEPPSSPSLKASANLSKAKSIFGPKNKNKTDPSKKQQQRRLSRNNLALRNLCIDRDLHTCIECNTVVDHFFSHFPMLTHCGACSYQTSCKASIGNHMIKFHSNISKQRFLRMDQQKKSPGAKLTLICLNCDLLVDASGGDLMTKHLTDKPDHVCQVVQEMDVKAQDKDQNKLHMQLQQPGSSQLLGTEPDEKQTDTDLKSAQSVAAGDAGQLESEGSAEMDASKRKSEEELMQPPAALASPSPGLGLKLAEESEGGSGT